MLWYYTLLARRPYLILVAVAVFSIACIVVSLTFQKIPDFSDPTLGFEARGTDIGTRLTAWKNLLEETRPSGMLIANPNDIKPIRTKFDRKNKKKNNNNTSQKNKYKKKLKFIKENNLILNKTAKIIDEFYENIDDNITENPAHKNNTNNKHWNYGRNLSYTNDEEINEKIEFKNKQWKLLREVNPPSATTDFHIRTDGYFCDSPNIEYAHFVVQRVNYNLTESLFELNGLLAMCDLEFKIEQINYYENLCEMEISSRKCCRPWSLPNYIALLSNKSSCFEIEKEDVDIVKTLLLNCYEYYQSFKLTNDCVNAKCRVPTECAQHNAVYNILHYLVDTEFIKVNETDVYLTAGMIFTPIAKSTKALPLYYNMKKISLSNDLVAVVAMDMGIKNALFDECILLDAWLIGIAFIFLMACMWVYTKSFFITIMTIIAIIFSIGIAYFVYTLIFELPFFPFLNVLAVIVIVGIGADDAFIYVKIWNCAIAEREKSLGLPKTSLSSIILDNSAADTLAGLIAITLRHAAVSMLVTSLTTAVAFYTSYINSITAIRCFGIFAGTAVISNYFLMITWLPATVSFVERLSCYTPNFCKKSKNTFFYSINQIGQFIEDSIISSIINLPKLWILLLGSIGIISGVIVFYYPKISLPDSPTFKLFDDSHPFEIYDSQFKNRFFFEKLYTDYETFKLPIRFVWGVQPLDSGNYLDPFSRGALYLDNNFNISAIESQQWLLNFCKDFKQQPFYQYNFGPPFLPNCFIENFIRTMERKCLDEMSGINRSPCCETSIFPYPPHIFDECLPQIISMLYESPRYVFVPGIAGPKFVRNGDETTNNNTAGNATVLPLVKALVVEYESTQSYTMSYSEIENFQKVIQTWFDGQLKTAPIGMQNAWFISDLEFFDLQNTLSQDTIYAIGLAMATSFLVLLLVTLNLLISLYAILTVTFTILTTVAILVLMNWKLNLLESISIITAIGLSVDFSLHFGLHYRMGPDAEREKSTRYALSRMLGPTAMAAITTGSAGAFMLPSSVLAYIQIGKFLVIVMSISWLFATFFLTSLLSAYGPQYGFGQFNYPKLFRKEKKNAKNQVEYNNRSSTLGTASEQLLSGSSSAAGEIVGSESHELSSLTSNSIVKPATTLETRPINFDRAFKNRCSNNKDNSPTSGSAITEILPDDCDIENLDYVK